MLLNCDAHEAGRVEHKKDPGIPNSLPFKEDILAEIEMGRRQASTA